MRAYGLPDNFPILTEFPKNLLGQDKQLLLPEGMPADLRGQAEKLFATYQSLNEKYQGMSRTYGNIARRAPKPTCCQTGTARNVLIILGIIAAVVSGILVAEYVSCSKSDDPSSEPICESLAPLYGGIVLSGTFAMGVFIAACCVACKIASVQDSIGEFYQRDVQTINTVQTYINNVNTYNEDIRNFNKNRTSVGVTVAAGSVGTQQLEEPLLGSTEQDLQALVGAKARVVGAPPAPSSQQDGDGHVQAPEGEFTGVKLNP